MKEGCRTIIQLTKDNKINPNRSIIECKDHRFQIYARKTIFNLVGDFDIHFLKFIILIIVDNNDR